MTASERTICKYLNILVNYLGCTRVEALDDLLQTTDTDGGNIEACKDEVEPMSVEQLTEFAVKRYPALRKKNSQQAIKGHMADEDFADILRNAVIESIAKHYPGYMITAKEYAYDDNEFVYCHCLFGKAHTFRTLCDDEKITTKVLALHGEDFTVGRNWIPDEDVYYRVEDYLWLLDNMPTMKNGEIKYGYGD